MYYILKAIHVCVGVLAMGVALGVVLRLFLARAQSACHFQKVVKQSFLINWCVVLPSLIVQMFLGFSIVGVKHYSIYLLWVYGTYIGYFVLLISWLMSNFFLFDILDVLRKQAAAEDFCKKIAKPWLLYKCAIIASLFSFLCMLFFMANRIS